MEKSKQEIFEFVANYVNINGEAVGKRGDVKVCVKNVLPGEKALVKGVFCKKDFCMAKLEKILDANPDRINPPCQYVNVCGGCDLQCIEAQNALGLKKQILRDYFKDFYDKDIVAVASPQNFCYRNKASFIVQNGKIGLVSEGSNKLVEVDKCQILKPQLNQVLKVAREWLGTCPNPHISHLVARVIEKKVTVTIVAGKKPSGVEIFKRSLVSSFGEKNVLMYINYNQSRDVILSGKWEHVFGVEDPTYCTKGVKYFVHPYSFLQVNDEVKDKIYEFVLPFVKGQVVVEGYSGVGILSAMMAKQAIKVFAVEINKQATADANKIKEENNLVNLQNLNGDCSKVLPGLIKENKDAIFVIDPPRSGCDKATLQALKDSEVSKILYISCNPYTLRQNVGFLNDKFKVDDMRLFDMFPQTSHVEVVAQLSLKR